MPDTPDSLNQQLYDAAAAGRRDDILPLVAAGASPLWRGKEGATALHLAAALPNGAAMLKDLLSSPKADSNARDEDDATPLHAAAGAGHIANMTVLIEARAEVDARNRWQATPLHEAAGSGFVDAVSLLLKEGAEANARDEGGYTALFKASHHGHLDAARRLVEGGADPEIPNNHGVSPLDLAARMDQSVPAEFLMTQFLAALSVQRQLTQGAPKAVKPMRPVAFKPAAPKAPA